MCLLSILVIFGSNVYAALSVDVGKQSHTVRLGEFPFHVSIQNFGSNFHHCGGIIIDPYFVLTAAHCIDGFVPEDFQIVVGTINLAEKDKIIREVVKLIPHENYSQKDSWLNDIGLMIVKEPLHFDNTKTINKAILSNSISDIPPGTKATVIGFGRTNPNGYTSKVLQEADVLVKKIDHCNKKYAKAKMHFRDTQICAQSSDGAGICKGDSGGALIIYGVVVGISSFTNNDCDHRKYPSVFTKISKYITWIDQQKLKNEDCQTINLTKPLFMPQEDFPLELVHL